MRPECLATVSAATSKSECHKYQPRPVQRNHQLTEGGFAWAAFVWCCSSLVSGGGDQPRGAGDVETEDELIDISMDSPGADSRWYKCTSVAAFNTTLEFDATTPISGKIKPGAIVEALEHADTRAGKRRIRSHKGWFSLVSTNGTRCELA